MCIAIYKPAGKVLTKELLAICFQNNPDGAGFAYINTDHLGVRRIKVYKSMEFDPFYKQYERATRIAPESPFLIHFRIKTHGQKDIANCHPFMVDEETVFIHNGIISGVTKDPDVSDTRMFNREVLRHLPEGWMFNIGIQTLIEDFIVSSKLAVMNIDGEVALFNEKKGVWHEECWMSNESFKERVTYYSTYQGGRYVPPRNQQRTTYPPTVPATTHSAAWHITAFTREECEFCSHIYQIKDMHAYEMDLGDYMLVCNECKKSLEKTGAVSSKDRTTIAKYLADANLRYNREKELATKTQDEDEMWRQYSQEYMM